MSHPSKLPRIGIRIPTWATFTREVFAGVVDHMREHMRWRIETPLESTAELHPVLIDEDWEGDGLIVFRYTPAEADAWLKRGIKVVNFSSECTDPRIPTVIPDNLEYGRLAAVHLVGLGLKNFAFWEDPERIYSRERHEGFAGELARHKFTAQRLGATVHKMNELEKADRVAMEMDRQIAKLPKPVGIFAKDDLAALEIIRSCARLDLRVPDDIAVIGCNDDFLFCYTADAPITSVRYPGRLIGYRLAEMLAGMLAGGTPGAARTVVPVSGIVVRESTGTHLHSPHVREALRIIGEEAPKKPIHVQEIVDRIPSSKATLQRRFQEETGETMKESIDRVRTGKIKDLLARTPLPIKVIAEEMDFESQEELSRFFKRTAGSAPSEYRRLHRPGAELFLREEES